MRIRTRFLIIIFLTLSILQNMSIKAQTDSLSLSIKKGNPVVLSSDTLFFINTKLGPFTPAARAQEINKKLEFILNDPKSKMDSLKIVESNSMTRIVLDTLDLMVVTDEDAALAGKTRIDLTKEYISAIKSSYSKYFDKYNLKSVLINVGIIAALLLAAGLLFWGMRKTFPKVYYLIDSMEGKLFRSLSFRSYEILNAKYVTGIIIVFAKGLRLAISLFVIYLLIIFSLALLPWTNEWNVEPLLRGIFFTVIVAVAAYAALRALNVLTGIIKNKIPEWKGTLIKPVKVKSVEILSDERIAELLGLVTQVLYFSILVVIGYFFITLVFSFFEFTQTWASTLFNYILVPLKTALIAFINYLPSLFTILVIIFLTRYVIKFVGFIFAEIGKGTITVPGFYKEWSVTTFKIARFLIIVFTAIVVFPYLPGSDSPFFQGISVFLGILFSLGSTSAVSNVVGGIVLTYMRPFQIGDRVKIADTIGDVVEKTLLVTRVRTIKNVDITIPNSMVLGSHIINFSSSAKEKGLILHTSVTISYDVSWEKVNELLISAAKQTENVLAEPASFVLQTSLDDFYVRYELNAFTDQPGVMAKTYSNLHQNIQDKFNDAGVEIMSPHYSALRDGNQTAIPQDYLPKNYKSPGFKISQDLNSPKDNDVK